jgi:hypothetical protein
MVTQPDCTEAARNWADVWQSAWEARDTEAIVALYHPDVVFSTQPFRMPHLRPVLRFDAAGLVVEQRDTWNQADGRREPPEGWGR